MEESHNEFWWVSHAKFVCYLIIYFNYIELRGNLTTFVRRSSEIVNRQPSPYSMSRLWRAKLRSKLAYVSSQVTSLVQAGFKQKTNLWKYEKLKLPTIFLAHVPMEKTNYTRRDHWEIARGGESGRGQETNPANMQNASDRFDNLRVRKISTSNVCELELSMSPKKLEWIC